MILLRSPVGQMGLSSLIVSSGDRGSDKARGIGEGEGGGISGAVSNGAGRRRNLQGVAIRVDRGLVHPVPVHPRGTIAGESERARALSSPRELATLVIGVNYTCL